MPFFPFFFWTDPFNRLNGKHAYQEPSRKFVFRENRRASRRTTSLIYCVRTSWTTQRTGSSWTSTPRLDYRTQDCRGFFQVWMSRTDGLDWIELYFRSNNHCILFNYSIHLVYRELPSGLFELLLLPHFSASWITRVDRTIDGIISNRNVSSEHGFNESEFRMPSKSMKAFWASWIDEGSDFRLISNYVSSELYVWTRIEASLRGSNVN